MITHPEHFILASASPRRADMLHAAGYAFEVQHSPVAEPRRRPRDIPLDLWPTALAFLKAYAVARECSVGTATVLGADTIVVLDGKILGKPRHRGDARVMLQRLSGRQHEVITGLALVRVFAGGGQGRRESSRTLTIRKKRKPGESFLAVRLSRSVATCRVCKLRDAWLEKYLDSGLWRGKAGAYGIQDHGDPWVRLVAGEFSTVAGLPMELLSHELAAMDSMPPQVSTLTYKKG